MHARVVDRIAAITGLSALLVCAATYAEPAAHFSRASILFGGTLAGNTSFTQPLFVTNTGDADLTFISLTITGPQASFFQVSGGTCVVGVPLPAGQRCRIDLVIKPTLQGSGPQLGNAATLTVQTNAIPASTDVALSGDTDDGPYVGTLMPVPQWLDFDPQAVQTVSTPRTLVITNTTRFLMHIERFFVSGNDDGDFELALNPECVPGSALASHQSCTATVTFSPSAAGPRSSEIIVRITNSNDGLWINSYSLTGVGIGTSAPVAVIEYYNAALDHYFITWLPAEIAILDAGVQIRGWMRTGETFDAYVAPVTGTSAVCRFYIPPPFGDSHFFGRGQQECDETAAKFPQFVNEDPRFMYVYLPVGGVCPVGTTEMHRAFSNRPDANHRYFTDPNIGTQMVAQHWLLEGDGPDLVVMCVPGPTAALD